METIGSTPRILPGCFDEAHPRAAGISVSEVFGSGFGGDLCAVPLLVCLRGRLLGVLELSCYDFGVKGGWAGGECLEAFGVWCSREGLIESRNTCKRSETRMSVLKFVLHYAAPHVDYGSP